MLRDRRTGDVAKLIGDVGRRQLLRPHEAKDRPAAGLGEGLECSIHADDVSYYLRKCQLKYNPDWAGQDRIVPCSAVRRPSCASPGQSPTPCTQCSAATPPTPCTTTTPSVPWPTPGRGRGVGPDRRGLEAATADTIARWHGGLDPTAPLLLRDRRRRAHRHPPALVLRRAPRQHPRPRSSRSTPTPARSSPHSRRSRRPAAAAPLDRLLDGISTARPSCSPGRRRRATRADHPEALTPRARPPAHDPEDGQDDATS